MWMKPIKTFGRLEDVGVGKYQGDFYVCVLTWDGDRMKHRFQKEWQPYRDMDDAIRAAEQLVEAQKAAAEDAKWRDMKD